MYLAGAFCVQYFPADQQDDIDFFSVPTIDPAVPSAEEAPTDGFFAAANSQNPAGAKELLSYLASAPAQQEFIEKGGSSNLPTSPDVDTARFSPLVKKGIELLNSTQEITQFFNRDSSDALQTTADAALTRFIADPSDIAGIQRQWQSAAQQVFSS
jgi:multiple sugar transport system substrate-binding protein